MILITGPRLSPDELQIQPGVEVKGFVPDLYKYFSASDLGVVQGGFSSTLELTALGRLFIYFSIEGHSEQDHVANRLARFNVGVRMYFSQTTPASLSEQILTNLNMKLSYKHIDTNGAQKAA
jgi:UDP-N-acetylglucosamine:LPS N-acetylglucosamine transferase